MAVAAIVEVTMAEPKKRKQPEQDRTGNTGSGGNHCNENGSNGGRSHTSNWFSLTTWVVAMGGYSPHGCLTPASD